MFQEDVNNARTLVRWPAGHGVPESHAHTGDFSVAVSTSIPTLAMAHCCFSRVLEKKDLPAELCLALLWPFSLDEPLDHSFLGSCVCVSHFLSCLPPVLSFLLPPLLCI